MYNFSVHFFIFHFARFFITKKYCIFSLLFCIIACLCLTALPFSLSIPGGREKGCPIWTVQIFLFLSSSFSSLLVNEWKKNTIFYRLTTTMTTLSDSCSGAPRSSENVDTHTPPWVSLLYHMHARTRTARTHAHFRRKITLHSSKAWPFGRAAQMGLLFVWVFCFYISIHI